MTGEAVLTEELVTLPTAARRCGLELDRLRRDVRLREAELLAAGVVLRCGPHRLVRADRLDKLAAIVGRA